MVIAIKWTTEDVQYRADILDISLSDTQADFILQGIEINHDANVGINWNVIDKAILAFKS